MADVDFSGPEISTITLRGLAWRIGPMKVGGHRRLRKAMGRIPRPKPPEVEVKGLVESMLQAAEDDGAGLDKPRRMILVQKARTETLQETVLQAVREARLMASLWPPDPADFRGISLIADNPEVCQEFIYVVLSANNPGFTMEQAARMAGNVEGSEEDSLTVEEQGELIERTLLRSARRLSAGDPSDGNEDGDQPADEGAGPKS
jgi:hypothetical protein